MLKITLSSNGDEINSLARMLTGESIEDFNLGVNIIDNSPLFRAPAIKAANGLGSTWWIQCNYNTGEITRMRKR